MIFGFLFRFLLYVIFATLYQYSFRRIVGIVSIASIVTGLGDIQLSLLCLLRTSNYKPVSIDTDV